MAAAGLVLEVRDLTVAIGGAAMVDRVSFDLAQGEILAIVGESGCGKTLTALSVIGLLPEAAQLAHGSIRLNGRELTALGEDDLCRIRGKEIGIVFQEPVAALDPLMTVGGQLIEAIRAHAATSLGEARDRAVQLLTTVGIPEPARRMRQYPFELSGGMCQRVTIAAALAAEPALLLADEPSTALDVTIQAQILELIKARQADTGTSVILITHDLGVVADMADRVIVMYAGRIVEEAPVADLFGNPRHPYTYLLLRSVPRLDDPPGRTLPQIEGTVPTAASLGSGCRFNSRCPLADDRCRVEEPPLSAIDGGPRRAACFHVDRLAALEAT